jgi:hypothetical protein
VRLPDVGVSAIFRDLQGLLRLIPVKRWFGDAVQIPQGESCACADDTEMSRTMPDSCSNPIAQDGDR